MPTIPYIRDLRNQVPRKKKSLTLNQSVSKEVYNHKTWKKLRNSYIAEHPLCENCLAEGRVTPAEEVHHIIPFLSGSTYQEQLDLAYDVSNLMSVCGKCHSELHKKLGGYGNYSNL